MSGLDAVPKKRGPKTDVLEALLKRVNGLEKRLKDEKKEDSAENPDNDGSSRNAQEQMADQSPESEANPANPGEREVEEKQMNSNPPPAVQ